MDKEPCLTCRGIQKVFGHGDSSVQALRDVNFTANGRECVIMMGPSGSGKTTLLSVVAGLLKPTGGECEILGAKIHEMDEATKTVFRGKEIGFIFQAFNLIPTLTAAENVMIPLLLLNEEYNIAHQKATQILEKVGLREKIDKYPKELSGGEQQRVSIARGLIHRPKILLCDEPTSQLDQQTGILIMDLLKKLQTETGCCIIIVTHDPRIESYADRIVIIDDGVLKTG